MQRAMFEEALTGAEAVGKSLRGKQAAELAKETGERIFGPAQAADNLRKHKPRLEMFAGKKIEGLDNIIDGFERLALVEKELAKSPTQPLLSADKLAKAGYDLLIGSRGQAMTELAIHGSRKRMAKILTNGEGRDALVQLLHPPKNWTLQNIMVNIGRINASIAKDDVMFGDEEEPNETP
jgi:hypothetical protein